MKTKFFPEFRSKEVGHSLGRAKGEWLFSRACPKENGRYLGFV